MLDLRRWWGATYGIRYIGFVVLMIFGFFIFLTLASKSDETKVWQYMGDDTYVGNFSVDSQELPSQRVFFYCIMVKNSSGMAKGAAALFCK